MTKRHSVLLVLIVSCSMAACGGGGGSGSTDTSPPPPVNRAPTVSAGADQTVNEGTSVSLQGTAIDADGSIATTSWSQVSGPTVTVNDASGLNASFVAPATDDAVVLTFELRVTDDDGAAASDQISITVESINDSPSASAGLDFRLWEQSVGILQGSGSDPEGDPLTFHWEQTGGPVVSLATPNQSSTEFESPIIDATTSLTFSLTVTDTSGASSSDSVAVTIAPLENIAGSILVDRTLSGAYEVTDDLSVAPGITLKISEGSLLRFHPNVALKVAGVLDVTGNASAPVFFAALKQTGPDYARYWGGISCTDCSRSSIRFAVIEDAVRGINLDGYSEVLITDNVFRKMAEGVADWSGYQPMEVHRNTFIDITESALSGIRTDGISRFSHNRFRNVSTAVRGYFFGETTIDFNDFEGVPLVIRAPEVGYGYGTVTAPNNWWGTTDEASIASMISDRYDDATLQEVAYRPFLDAPPANAGSIIPANAQPPGPK